MLAALPHRALRSFSFRYGEFWARLVTVYYPNCHCVQLWHERTPDVAQDIDSSIRDSLRWAGAMVHGQVAKEVANATD